MMVAMSSSVGDVGQFAQVGRCCSGEVGVRHDAVAGGLGGLDQDDRLERRQRLADLEEAFEETVVFDHGQLRLAVVDQIVDLFGGRGVVDRHRSRSEEEGGDVQGVELRSVAHHQHDRVALADAEVGEAGRQACGEVGEFGHRPSVPLATGVFPAQDLDGPVGVEIAEESFPEVLSDDAVVQFLAGGHWTIVARPGAK